MTAWKAEKAKRAFAHWYTITETPCSQIKPENSRYSQAMNRVILTWSAVLEANHDLAKEETVAYFYISGRIRAGDTMVNINQFVPHDGPAGAQESERLAEPVFPQQ